MPADVARSHDELLRAHGRFHLAADDVGHGFVGVRVEGCADPGRVLDLKQGHFLALDERLDDELAAVSRLALDRCDPDRCNIAISRTDRGDLLFYRLHAAAYPVSGGGPPAVDGKTRAPGPSPGRALRAVSLERLEHRRQLAAACARGLAGWAALDHERHPSRRQTPRAPPEQPPGRPAHARAAASALRKALVSSKRLLTSRVTAPMPISRFSASRKGTIENSTESREPSLRDAGTASTSPAA